ncbi:hypothetical protein I316_05795 [Kwoniella heveanensis BCC8398]|uniref:BZIP domain-containing protein n=1 Tax=Kwoniella heveanensis BCC8398 TaxID=1296120 RepID=A0A1B9GP76_9TREE|nr:hypothetical protein I316_05795 [Kwoniella heveanensis BCC8398]
MDSNPFSPAASSSSRGDDINMVASLGPEKGMDLNSFESLFNFDGFESSGETSVSSTSTSYSFTSSGVPSESFEGWWLINVLPYLPLHSTASDQQSFTHSPTTASPNYTPSPPSIHSNEEPMTYNPSASFDFLGADGNIDFPLDFSFGNEVKAGPVQEEVVQIKQEPVEFGFSDISNSQSPVTQARPMPVPQQLLQPEATSNNESFPGLPVDQQMALQQLMSNILNYQKQFGLELPAPAQAASTSSAPSTIEPSMLFSNASAPVVNSAPKVSPAPVQPSPVAQQVVPEGNHHDDEPLRAVEPHELAAAAESSRSVRQASIASSGIEDLDSKIDKLVPLDTIFSAGKGKGGKKGGGMSSVVRGDDEDIDDDESWRPSPEEYKKLSSKEKRQLRNKLSARAFRTRRKDYIGTLEAHIQDRDSVIDEMRAELVNSRTENQDLRRELAALKASTMSILHPETANKTSVSPAMVNALAMSPSLASPTISNNATAGPGPNTIRRSNTPLNTYNPRKDIPSSYKGGWGGNDNMFGGGSTICHTMFTPDLVLPSSSTPTSGPAPTPAPLRSLADLPRVNLNPHLNEEIHTSRGPALANIGNGQDNSRTFSAWSEETPFSLRSMDSYRMQMWSRLAREAAADKANLAGDMRPKFFVEAKDEKPDPASIAAAAAAAAASSHITSKLATSFWSAFQGNGAGQALDTDKLAAVVTGQAKLKVVLNDVEKTSSSTSASTTASVSEDQDDCLSSLLGSLKLQCGPGMGLVRSGGVGARENPIGTLCGFLRHASAMPARA